MVFCCQPDCAMMRSALHKKSLIFTELSLKMSKELKENVDECPYSSVNIFSHLSVNWMNPLFEKGQKKKISQSDLYPVAGYDKSSYLTNKLEESWNKELDKAMKGKRQPSFTKAFVQTYWLWFLYYGFIQLLSETSRAATPLLIGELSLYFSNPKLFSLDYAYAYATGIAVMSIVATVINQLDGLNMQRFGWNARTAVIGLMFKKTLKLNHEALAKTTTGKIVNLSATDALRFDDGFMFIHYMWLSPLLCLGVTCLLWERLGMASLAGISTLFAVMIVQTFLGRAFASLRLKAASLTDLRVDTMSEIISGMRIIKMYSWEKSFKEIVTNLRKNEMHKILFSSLIRCFTYTTMQAACLLPVFTSFLAYAALGGELTLQTALVVVGFFNVIRLGVGVVFPLCISNLAEVRVSLQRTEEFLLLPEKELSLNEDEDSDTLIKMDDFTGSWNHDGETTLKNVSFEVERGKLLVVVGPVGSGKSSLLSAISKELPAQSGKVNVHGNIAYSSQIAWLLSESIRENILFDESYDPHRYQKVTKACALDKDFEILPHGDATLVGERGVTLSGGQKARVSLARSAYCSDSDIALFDDPLSAVDPSVANHLFDECICGIMKDKARVLVTHQLQFLEKADEIIVLKDGQVLDCGTYAQLQAKGADLVSLVETYDDTVHDDGFDKKTMDTLVELHFPRHHVTSIENIELVDESVSLNDAATDDNDVNEARTTLNEKEHFEMASDTGLESSALLLDESAVKFSGSCEMHSSSVDLTHSGKETSRKTIMGTAGYYQYFKAGASKWYLVVLFIVMLGNYALLMMTDWWLVHWASASETHSTHVAIYMTQQNLLNETTKDVDNESAANITIPVLVTTNSPLTNATIENTIIDISFDQQYYVILYTVFTLGFLAFLYTQTVMNMYLCMRSSVQLHAGMLAAILRAKIRFFDTNPVGGVLNRFSKDMNQVDEILPLAVVDVIFLGGFVLTIFLYVIIVNYLVIVVVIPMGIYCVWIRRYYVTTSREVKKLEGSSRSPVFGHLSSTLQGLALIRSFRAEQSFIRKHHRLQDSHGAAWSGYLHGARWFAFRIDMATAIFIAFCALFGVTLTSLLPDSINAANLGLTLTSSIRLLGVFQWAVRRTAEVENLMTSVGRIREYHKISPEAEDGKKAEKPPTDWPINGSISFDNVFYAYFSGGPMVLKNITLDIKPREKLGIVGRTGAGKSSIIASIFRMSDHVTGSIVIDGMDTSQLDLHDLRSSLAIIPQDPILFGGTMRRNLDAFSSYTDDQLWSALEQVQLKPLVENLPLKLESKLNESGSNLSVGQRQLVCLARAILRNNKILIIDEATANVDLRTDQLIQETIRSKFSLCTVITVAHRLNTIITSDRILVLDNGEVLECDNPHVLLQNPDGVFTGMVGATGDQEGELRKAAQKAYSKIFCERNEGEVIEEAAMCYDRTHVSK